MFSQRTLGESVAAVGIGLHSGRKIRLVLRPAPADTGIVFRRVDLEPPVDIPAQPLNVNDTRMATTVNVGRAAVATIEHLMSAFSGLGVDNCIVEVNAPEIPVMDGSGASFVYLLHSAGIVEQKAARKFVRILKPIEVREGDKLARLEPHEGFRLPSESRSDTPRLMRPISTPTSTFRASTTNRRWRTAAPSASCRTWKCCGASASLRADRSTTPS